MPAATALRRSRIAAVLPLGPYADSGFGNATGPACATRVNVSPTSDMEFLVRDRALPAAGTNASASRIYAF